VAFQIALWELVYDGSNPGDANSLNDGTFKHRRARSPRRPWPELAERADGDTSLFNSRLAGMELVTLIGPAGRAKSQDNIQDQIALRPSGVVPPAGLILAGIGFIAFGAGVGSAQPDA